MAGVKNKSHEERNIRICVLRRSGFTYSQIAQMEGISRPRVAQIVHEYNVELGEDEGRAEIASALEFAEQKCVELITRPGPMMAPNGRPAQDAEGEPIPNNGIVIEALKTLVLVEDKRSRLFAWDKQQQRQSIAQEAAVASARAALDALAAAKAVQDAETRRQIEADVRRSLAAPPVRGEVIAELPPSPASGQDSSEEKGRSRLCARLPRHHRHAR